MSLIKTVEKDGAHGLVREIFDKFEAQSGSVPEWAKVMAHRPEILKNFIALFNSIMIDKGRLEPLLKWKIAYVVSQTLKCKFCMDVTAKMLKKLGADESILQKIVNLECDNEKEREILALVKDVTLDGYLDQPEILDKLKTILDEAELVELVSVVGLFNYINRFNNTFAILPE